MAQFLTAYKHKKCGHIPYGKGLSMQVVGMNIRQGSGIFDSATSSYVSLPFFEDKSQ